MAGRIGLFNEAPALGVRLGPERREHDRRRLDRDVPDRRKKSRRQARIRSAILSLLTLTIPIPAKLNPMRNGSRHEPVPSVSTEVTSFDPVDPKRAYDRIIREAALTYNVDPALIRSVIHAESRFDATAVSGAGAVGLMQLMPSVANTFGVKDRFDPRENIMAGTRLLRELLDQYHGNLPLVLAGYNAGAKAIARFGRVPPFKETRNYIQRVTQRIREDHNGDLGGE